MVYKSIIHTPAGMRQPQASRGIMMAQFSPPCRAIDPFLFEGAFRALRIRLLSSRMTTAPDLDNGDADTYEEKR